MRVFRIIFFNTLGLIVGVLVGNIALLISNWLFIDLLGKFKLITSILCWPVDYSTYAFTAIIIIVALSSLYSCFALCRFGKGNLNFACILIGLYEIIVFAISFIETISKSGFSLDIIWMIVITLLTFGILTFSTATNSEL